MKKFAAGIVGLLVLPVWALAAGQVGTIQGSVLDSSGRPIVGALVTMATMATAGPSALDRMVFTDSRGGFSFENLVLGEYAVQATMPRFAAQKEKIQLTSGANASVKFNLQTVAELLRRAASRDARQSQDIVWALRSSRGTQSVLRFRDSPSPPLFSKFLPEYSGYFQLYSKGDPGARAASNAMGSRFSVTLGLPSDGKLTLSGRYSESPLEPKGASALYEFKAAEGHSTRIGVNVRQGIVLDNVFSAEELREFQVQYSDKFYLAETLVAEQGAEMGHAEGRASNNYFRPKASLSWVPNARTVLTAGFNTQAPDRGDDPVRGREYFEQVNLPPAFEHYLHTEIGASQFLDDVTKVSVALFQDKSNFRALFVSAADGRRGLLILDGKATPSQGVRLNLNREFHGFEAGLGYTVAKAAGFRPGASNVSNVEEMRGRVTNRDFHVVTARIKTDFDLTDTELTAVYRWISRYAVGPIDPYQHMVEYNDPTLSISVAQNLPTFGAIPAKIQAIFDARNLLEQPVSSSKAQLIHSPRFVKGGINIRF